MGAAVFFTILQFLLERLDIYGRSIIDRLTVALEHHDDCADNNGKKQLHGKSTVAKRKSIRIPPLDVDNLFFSLFADPKHVETPKDFSSSSFVSLSIHPSWNAGCLTV